MAEAGFMPLRIEEVDSPDVLTDALRFRRAMEIDTVGILLFSPSGEILRTNHAFLRMSGYTQDDVRSGKLHWTDITPPEWKAASLAAMHQFKTTGSVVPYEKQYFRKDRSRFWVLVASKMLSDGEGISFVLDITERKEAECKLQEIQLQLERSDTQLQTITDAIPNLIAYVDPKLHYIRVNQAYAEFFGFPPGFVIDKHMQGILGTAFSSIRASLERALVGELQHIDVILPNHAGEPRYMSSQFIPDLSPEGHVLGVVLQSSDLTERRKTEHLLRTAEKLAAVGRLAASMAHEINNPLEAVTNLLFLARESRDYATTQIFLEQAEKQLRRVAAITTQTLRFHKQSTRPMAIRAEDLFSSVLAIYAARLLNGDVEIRQRLRATEPVLCLDGEIRQVISNLVSNALDAMVGRVATLVLRACISVQRTTGRRGMRITVADSGRGMSQAVLDQVGEAFFSTKEIGGTGLGLWISQDIVQRHAGTIRMRSRAGQGTAVMVWLPLEASVR